MRILQNGRDASVQVQAVYWNTASAPAQTLFLIIPYDGYEGLTAVRRVECDILHASLDGFTFVENSNGNDMLVRDILLSDNLLDRMIEHDPDAMAQYLRLAGSSA